MTRLDATSGPEESWLQLGHADPALTLRVYAHAMRGEERDISFAEFDPKRPYTAPSEIDEANETSQPLDFVGGPPGARTLDPCPIYLNSLVN